MNKQLDYIAIDARVSVYKIGKIFNFAYRESQFSLYTSARANKINNKNLVRGKSYIDTRQY